MYLAYINLLNPLNSWGNHFLVTPILLLYIRKASNIKKVNTCPDVSGIVDYYIITENSMVIPQNIKKGTSKWPSNPATWHRSKGS